MILKVTNSGAKILGPKHSNGPKLSMHPRRPDWIALALLVDALCFGALALDLSFPVFMSLRFLEGCAHIFALSMLLGLAAGSRPPEQRGGAMGIVGAGLLLGVALGAPLGGILGRDDPLRPLQVGAVLLVATAVLARVLLRETVVRGSEQRPGLAEIVALVRTHRLVAVPLAFAFADRFTVGFFTTTFSLYLRRIHDLPPEHLQSV